ncbi:MAG: hypothetical protein IT214_08750 [Chitinophagaceae bacterium]|jgi:hypothetical protein|nr:hypothetical protein [Chitinophagaceae bacterium]OQY95490.1 MAG: hypothetical protein B6D37_05715 [Sphingobacteriales bacterium UTBCD1]
MLMGQAYSQNINGFWKGTLTLNGCFQENNIELQIHVNGKEVTGDSYHYQDIDNYVKKKIQGYYDPSSKKLTLQETIVTTYHIPTRCVICIKKFELQYSKNGNTETLNGAWSGNVQNSSADCAGGSLTLSRETESAFKEIPEIKVDTGTIRLDFYDNGIVDGDSITVMVNKKTVAVHQLLSTKPVTMFIKIDPENTFQEVEMVAENLGSIPPNTALLIITAGKKRYRLYLSSTEMKSARVRFVYDPDTNRNTDDR